MDDVTHVCDDPIKPSEHILSFMNNNEVIKVT